MKKWFTFFVLGVFLIGVVYAMMTLSRGRTTFFGKAEQGGIFNSTNSYVFASPLSASVDGESVRLTIFALDNHGKGIPNKSVTIDCKTPVNCQSSGVKVSGVQTQTDTLGRAMYDISSSVAGKFEMQASVDGTPIPQTVTVSFQ